MKNVEKIITALSKEFSGHKVEISYNFNAHIYSVFIDDEYVGNFEDRFCEKDFDNPEIEIKVKAPLKCFTDYLDTTYKNENLSKTEYIIRDAIGRGMRKWVDGSHQNS